MWAVSVGSPPGPCHTPIPKPTKPPLRLRPSALSVSVNSPPPDHDVGGLGHTMITAVDSNTKRSNQDEGEEEGRQISGSDVLWALQKAAAHKNRVSGMKKKMNKKKNGKVSSSSHVETVFSMDYSNVRPLSIKSEWVGRLDELDKRLRELSSETF